MRVRENGTPAEDSREKNREGLYGGTPMCRVVRSQGVIGIGGP